jgi:hypothetical protein
LACAQFRGASSGADGIPIQRGNALAVRRFPALRVAEAGDDDVLPT